MVKEDIWCETDEGDVLWKDIALEEIKVTSKLGRLCATLFLACVLLAIVIGVMIINQGGSCAQ